MIAGPTDAKSAAPGWAGDPPRIEPFRWWHVEPVIVLEGDLFGEEQWSPAMFWNELANGHYYRVALDPDGTVLGYAGLAVVPPYEAWVQNIAVRRDAQRRGTGRALLESLLAEAARRQVRKVLLEVAVTNERAQKLYQGYGFEVVGLRRGYYQPSNTDALVMLREQPEEG
jgi:ribosomal-protein-alanine N-acetyltransferase